MGCQPRGQDSSDGKVTHTSLCAGKEGNYYNLIRQMRDIDIHWSKIEFPACISKEAEWDFLQMSIAFQAPTLHEYSISSKSREWIRYTHSVEKSFPVKSPPC